LNVHRCNVSVAPTRQPSNPPDTLKTEQNATPSRR